MTDLAIGSPWAPYGLRDDPYFQQPLEPRRDERAARPITLFVGRDRDLQLLGNQIVGSSNSRAIVQGDAGVGKTSFVNCLKSVLVAHDVPTHADPVRVKPGMSPHHFVAEVLKVLIQMRATLELATSGALTKKIGSAAKRETGLDAAQTFWRRVGRLIQGEDSTAAGVSVAALGVQREHVRIPRKAILTSSRDEKARSLVLKLPRS